MASISEIHHVAITVSDIERSIAFYRDVLGFRKTLDVPLTNAIVERVLRLHPDVKGRSVIMQQGPSQIGEVELIQFENTGLKPSGPKRPGDPGMFLLSFSVSGEVIDDTKTRLEALGLGVQCYGAPTTIELPEYGDIRVIIFEDPDGIMIELVQLPTADEVRAFRGRKAHA
ncbi:MAG: VOC family protein [Alphaproteobacteria bacterium]